MSAIGEALAVDPTRSPCAGATLARLLQPAILTILAGEALHGYQIVKRAAKMEVFGGERPDPTGVYRALRIMERRGLVISAWRLSLSGPARRSYRLTNRGGKCLDRWIDTLDRYRQAIGDLVASARKLSGRIGKRTIGR